MRLTQLTKMLITWMENEGVQDVKASTKKHIRRKLMTEFGSVIHFLSDDEGKLLVYPDNLT